LLSWCAQHEAASAASVLGGFETGTYALSTQPIPADTTLRIGTETFCVATEGVGVSPVHARRPCAEPTPITAPFTWHNDHYTAAITTEGLAVDGRPGQARIEVRADAGDTYSSEPGELIGELSPTGTPLLSTSDLDAQVSYRAKLETDSIRISADVVVRFDHTPLINIDIVLDSDGTGFRADVLFDSGIESDSVSVSMPFDVVERAHRDDDLLPHDIPDDLKAILMGQRETGSVDEFPVHDFLALSDQNRAWAVLGSGNRSCSSTPDGTMSLGLRRATEWLALTGLSGRSGDAGPAMYVPGARCEREVIHRLALVVLPGPDTIGRLVPLSEAFHNPALIADVDGEGTEIEWRAFTESLPMTSLAMEDGTPTARFYNPHNEPHPLTQPRPRTSLRGSDLGSATELEPKEIVTLAVPFDPPPAPMGATVTVLNPTEVRVGPSRSVPESEVLDALVRRISDLEQKLAENSSERASATGSAAYRLEHLEYVLDRERLELQLSLELNRRLQASTDEVSIPDHADPEIADLGWELNELRVKRRIFDYVVQSLAD
ncbi:MAG: hypothetical protein HKN24_07565, partial [Acidimicrobiales bacterium]|nr:hypothetical protein [Acidimicrobiales bacterium]